MKLDDEDDEEDDQKFMFASNFDGRGDRLTNDCVNIKSLGTWHYR